MPFVCADRDEHGDPPSAVGQPGQCYCTATTTYGSADFRALRPRHGLG